jgi:hypothetical protein
VPTQKNLLVSDVTDTADHKIGDIKVDFLGEFESICKKALARISVAQVEMFDGKNQKIS